MHAPTAKLTNPSCKNYVMISNSFESIDRGETYKLLLHHSTDYLTGTDQQQSVGQNNPGLTACRNLLPGPDGPHPWMIDCWDPL